MNALKSSAMALAWLVATSAPALLHAAAVKVPALTQWAETNGVHLRYELSGRGTDTVVLMHEMSTSLESWDYIAPELARTHRVLRYDLRGFGLSERAQGALTMNDEMEDLRGLLDTLGIHEKVTLVGGAVGGAIALNFAAVHPDLVKGVVAISPAAYMKPGGMATNMPAGSASAAPVSAAPGAQSVDAAYPVALQKAHPDRYAHFLAIQAAADQQGTTVTTPAVYAVAFSEVLPRIQTPTLIVATSQWMRPPSSFKELADATPKGQFKVIDTGHFAAIESPELVLPVVKEFLAQNRALH
jgi:3-oxoadipate enol-lactonase